MTVAEWFSLLETRGPALRTAGVLEISLEGVTIRFAPAPFVMPAGAATAQTTPGTTDPLDEIPGYTLLPEDAP